MLKQQWGGGKGGIVSFSLSWAVLWHWFCPLMYSQLRLMVHTHAYTLHPVPVTPPAPSALGVVLCPTIPGPGFLTTAHTSHVVPSLSSLQFSPSLPCWTLSEYALLGTVLFSGVTVWSQPQVQDEICDLHVPVRALDTWATVICSAVFT